MSSVLYEKACKRHINKKRKMLDLASGINSLIPNYLLLEWERAPNNVIKHPSEIVFTSFNRQKEENNYSNEENKESTYSKSSYSLERLAKQQRKKKHLLIEKELYLSKADFLDLEFENKGYPDLLFIITYLLYGKDICDYYTNTLNISEFKLQSNNEYGILVQRLDHLDHRNTITLKIAQYFIFKKRKLNFIRKELRNTARENRLEVNKDLRKAIVKLFLNFKDFEARLPHVITLDSFIEQSVYRLKACCEQFNRICCLAGNYI